LGGLIILLNMIVINFALGEHDKQNYLGYGDKKY